MNIDVLLLFGLFIARGIINFVQSSGSRGFAIFFQLIRREVITIGKQVREK